MISLQEEGETDIVWQLLKQLWKVFMETTLGLPLFLHFL
jgi:hypothetical protein